MLRFKTLRFRGTKGKEANAILGIACQNAAYLAVICDLELRFGATTGGRFAIWELASLKHCDSAFVFWKAIKSYGAFGKPCLCPPAKKRGF